MVRQQRELIQSKENHYFKEIRRMARQKFRRVHTRKIDRMVAKNNMHILGISVHDCIKHGRFSDAWKEYSKEVKA